MSLIYLCSSSFGAAAPPEAVALLRLLDSLRAVEEDLVGVWYGVGFAATKLSAMISIMMSS